MCKSHYPKMQDVWFLFEKISEIIKNTASLRRWKIWGLEYPGNSGRNHLPSVPWWKAESFDFSCASPVFSWVQWCLSNDNSIMEAVVVLGVAYSRTICTNNCCLITWNYTIFICGNPRGPRFLISLMTAKKVRLAREQWVQMWEWLPRVLSLVSELQFPLLCLLLQLMNPFLNSIVADKCGNCGIEDAYVANWWIFIYFL